MPKKNELEMVAGDEAPVVEYAGLSEIADEETAQQDAVDGAQEEAQAQQQAQEQEDNVQGWVKAVEAAGDMICSMIPEATPVWNKKRMEALGGALARCDEAYGWGGVGGLFEHPLIGLGFAAFPLVVGTGRAVKEAQKNRPVDVDAREVPKEHAADPMGGAAAGPTAAAA